MIAAQLIEAINVDLRQTEVRRAGHPGVDAIDCRRIRSMVSSKNRLPEPVETEPRLIDPAGVGHPGVIETENLSPQSRLRFPLFAQNGDVEFRLQAVAEKVTRGHAVALVKVMVSFDDEIVVAVFVRQSNVELGVIDAVRVGVRIGWIKRRELDT